MPFSIVNTEGRVASILKDSAVVCLAIAVLFLSPTIGESVLGIYLVDIEYQDSDCVPQLFISSRVHSLETSFSLSKHLKFNPFNFFGRTMNT
jgi:hypothetical protein